MSAHGWQPPMDEPPGPPPVTAFDLVAAQERLDAEMVAARKGTGSYESFKSALVDLNALYDRATNAQRAIALEAMQRDEDQLAAARAIGALIRQEHER